MSKFTRATGKGCAWGTCGEFAPSSTGTCTEPRPPERGKFEVQADVIGRCLEALHRPVSNAGSRPKEIQKEQNLARAQPDFPVRQQVTRRRCTTLGTGPLLHTAARAVWAGSWQHCTDHLNDTTASHCPGTGL